MIASVRLEDSPPQIAWKKINDYDINGNQIYEGWALPGTATSAAGWKIRKNTFDVSNNLLTTVWATVDDENPIAAENCVWDDRAGLTYS